MGRNVMTNIEKLMQSIVEEGACAMVTDPVNRRYFTGFKSSEGVVLCFCDKAYFLVDFRYYEKAAEVVKGMDVILMTDRIPQITDILLKHSAECLMIEADTMTVSELNEAAESFSDIVYIDSSSELSDIITDLRFIKEQSDVEKIIAAQRIAEQGFEYVLENIKRGMTEKEVALMLDNKLKLLGAEDISFDTIVLFDRNASLPHGVPGNDRLEKGFVLMDFGAVVDGYHSDMTRTFYAGTPSEREKMAYETVLKAQLAGINAAAPGLTGKQLDAVAREIIDATEFKGTFGHSLGHGVGMEIHEEPRVSSRNEDILEPGMIITVEPGIYLPGEFGIRIEDMGVITEDSFNDITKAPKDLIII